MLPGQRRVKRAVIDDEVHHHFQAMLVRPRDHLADLFLLRSLAGRIQHQRVVAEMVGDRVDAAGVAGILDRVDEHPVKLHCRRALEMLGPPRKRPGQQWEQIVDDHFSCSMAVSNK